MYGPPTWDSNALNLLLLIIYSLLLPLRVYVSTLSSHGGFVICTHNSGKFRGIRPRMYIEDLLLQRG